MCYEPGDGAIGGRGSASAPYRSLPILHLIVAGNPAGVDHGVLKNSIVSGESQTCSRIQSRSRRSSKIPFPVLRMG